MHSTRLSLGISKKECSEAQTLIAVKTITHTGGEYNPKGYLEMCGRSDGQCTFPAITVININILELNILQ